MEDNMSEKVKVCKESRHWHNHHGCGAVYGMGFVGALIYFIQHSTTFWLGVLGVLKAVVWPALVVYKALELLKF